MSNGSMVSPFLGIFTEDFPHKTDPHDVSRCLIFFQISGGDPVSNHLLYLLDFITVISSYISHTPSNCLLTSFDPHLFPYEKRYLLRFRFVDSYMILTVIMIWDKRDRRWTEHGFDMDIIWTSYGYSII